jgi:hypothetical protein
MRKSALRANVQCKLLILNRMTALARFAAYLAKKLAVFRQLLAHPASQVPEFVLVPDTNVLLNSAEPADYADVIDSKMFRFVIAPTVLAELDELKRLRAAQPVGVKAEKAIRMIKGWRNQGSILEGVTVAKTITIQMIPTEPRMSDLPSWLDAENKDDRIIGTILRTVKPLVSLMLRWHDPLFVREPSPVRFRKVGFLIAALFDHSCQCNQDIRWGLTRNRGHLYECAASVPLRPSTNCG